MLDSQVVPDFRGEVGKGFDDPLWLMLQNNWHYVLFNSHNSGGRNPLKNSSR